MTTWLGNHTHVVLTALLVIDTFTSTSHKPLRTTKCAFFPCCFFWGIFFGIHTHNVLVNIQSRYTAVLIEVTANLVVDTSTSTSRNPLETPVWPLSYLLKHLCSYLVRWPHTRACQSTNQVCTCTGVLRANQEWGSRPHSAFHLFPFVHGEGLTKPKQ